MKMTNYLSNASNLYGQNRLLKFVVVVLGITTVVNTYMIRNAQQMEKVVIIPSVINDKMWLSGTKASDEYVKQFARDVSNMFLTYHPSNVRTNFNDLLAMYDPSEFAEAQRVLYNLAERIEESKAASGFYITKLVNNEEKHQLEITGSKTMIINGKVTDNSIKIYLLDYKIESGKFCILRFMEKSEYDKYKYEEAANAKK
ncbi:type IV conjugative transfer system protein TraE [Pelobacter propionicus]|uniref:Conserved hypothetical sex pilus assembly and synthesis protein n=1 Tax=Pelobacter propionicus (strain DSM 2379 / NBRC 103807 / OttBd1) TaxID=338966 RepID=A0R7R2_PELPD|nr:type IV conjugative transfer system protein TraE [Pelobacter propionicus]ABL01370.1 conserved hypothetical sex pilus assembly and synthesis protein [Pelobacter propionicus DSM 2379]